MKRVRSIYADLHVKGSYRAKYTPRISRFRRPHVIAWAGPAAFYPNRFYKQDKWYKARIEKPEKIPLLHVIDPDNFLQPLSERLKVVDQPRVNIGFKERVFKSSTETQADDRNLESLARKMQLMIDLKNVEHNPVSVLNHFRIFDDLFGHPVFFNVTQRMRVSFGLDVAYSGNVLLAAHTKEKPNVEIEKLGGGFTTLLAVNLDGNPFLNDAELIHWMVSNIPDGKNIGAGCENVPYLQALPFRGTGYHRFAFVLFRHDEELDLSSYDLKKFYKENEEKITPSSIAFLQTKWDISVNHCLHEMGLKAPHYKYAFEPPLKMEQKEFPNKPQPFDLYLDQFRDPVEMETEILKKRLRMRSVSENPQQPKYPDINYQENKRKMPAWQHNRLIKENVGAGRYYALWNNPID